MKTNRLLLGMLVASGLTLMVSCGSDTEASLPPIGGFDSADDVAATALRAYWPLNGNGKESISGTNPTTTVAASYVAGVKGQGVAFNEGYMAYPSITALNTTSGSASISLWAILQNNRPSATVDGSISPMFSLTRTGDMWGNLNLIGETNRLATSDSIVVKGIYRIKLADGSTVGGDAVNALKQEPWMDATHTWNANKISGVWAHIVYVFDGPTGTNRIYVNGQKISNSAWEVRNDGAALNLNHTLPTRPVLGAMENVVTGTNTDGWNKALKGSIDEVRVYDKALTQAEIGALYELEKAGR